MYSIKICQVSILPPKVVRGPRNNAFTETDIVPTCMRVYSVEVKNTKQIFAVKCCYVHSTMTIHCRSGLTSSNW